MHRHARSHKRVSSTLAARLVVAAAIALSALATLAWQAGGSAAASPAMAVVAPYRPLTIPLAPPVTLAVAAARYYTVRAGQTLSSISAELCTTPSDWTGIYAASRAAGLTAWNANDLVTGQRLRVECYQLPSMADRAPLPKPPPVKPPVQLVSRETARYSPSGGSSPAYRAPVQAQTVSTAGDGSFESCVIAAESGGQTQVMNSSGHYGLFQFDYQTWVSGGGAPADFGHASAAEQQAVFSSVYAARGTEPWGPSDGC